jgi:hypothetical protein
MRERKNSAERDPARKTRQAKATSQQPLQLLLAGIEKVTSRRSPAMYSARGGMSKPYERAGCVHQSETRSGMIAE